MDKKLQDEMISRLIANTINHEMVRPLSLLAVNKEYLWTRLGCDRADADESICRSLDEIELARAHMEYLWKNSVDLFACLHGNVQPRMEPVDVGELLRLLGEESQTVERVTGVSLQVQCPEEMLCVITDGDIVERILLNLLSCILQLSEPGGKVCLSARLLDEGGARLCIETAGEDVYSLLAHALCEEADWDGEDTGWMYSGIGLHLCRELCSLLHWEPRAETDRRGTRITLTIPADRMATSEQLVFRSGETCVVSAQTKFVARIRQELGSLVGMEKYRMK